MLSLTSEAKAVLWAALALFFLCGGLWAIHHERQIGAAETLAAVQKARDEEHAKVVAQTAALQAAADAAAGARDAVQKKLDAYMAAHPVGPVFVCHSPSHSQPAGVPGAAGTNSADAGAGSGSAPVGGVPSGSEDEATDIGPELDTIVRSAGAMAGLYQQFQSQPVPKVN